MTYKPNNYKGVEPELMNAAFTGAIRGLARTPMPQDEAFILEWIRMEIAAYDEAIAERESHENLSVRM